MIQHSQSCHAVFVVDKKPLAEQQKRQLHDFILEAQVEVYTGGNPMVAESNISLWMKSERVMSSSIS